MEITQQLLDRALDVPRVNHSPLPEYGYPNIDYGMTIGVARTPGGRLWACWVGGGDNEAAFFVLASSDDDGDSWSDPRLVIDPHDPALPCARSALVGTLWCDPAGRLWLFFDQSLAHFDGRAGDWAIRCDDPDAADPQWTAPQYIWHGMTLNKPTVLANGEWLLPVSLWTRNTIDPRFRQCHHQLDSLRMANVLVSADQGQTWLRRGGVTFPQSEFDEHMLVERRDGSLWMLARTRDNIWQSCSVDQGRSWSAPCRTGIEHISSRFHIRRLASGRLLLVKHGRRTDERTEQRSHLCAFLSDDDGATWFGGLPLDERDGISYPDSTQAPDGRLYITYDRNRGTDGEILLARICEADILAGRCTASGSTLRHVVTRAAKRSENP